MYVRIEYQGKKYYSYVFAHFECDYMPQYVVYDPFDDKFDIVSHFSKKWDGVRQIGWMNENENDFIKVSSLELIRGTVYKCAGYGWLINNVDLIKEIELGNKLDEKYQTLAREMNATINPDAWNEVNTADDAADFMYHVGAFHDTYLIGMEAEADYIDFKTPAKLRLKFHSPGAFNILVEFEDGIFIKYSFYSANRIYLSSIVIDGKNKYWVDGDEDLRPMDIENFQYIQANHIRWKFILKDDGEW